MYPEHFLISITFHFTFLEKQTSGAGDGMLHDTASIMSPCLILLSGGLVGYSQAMTVGLTAPNQPRGCPIWVTCYWAGVGARGASAGCEVDGEDWGSTAQTLLLSIPTLETSHLPA